MVEDEPVGALLAAYEGRASYVDAAAQMIERGPALVAFRTNKHERLLFWTTIENAKAFSCMDPGCVSCALIAHSVLDAVRDLKNAKVGGSC